MFLTDTSLGRNVHKSDSSEKIIVTSRISFGRNKFIRRQILRRMLNRLSSATLGKLVRYTVQNETDSSEG